MTRPDLDALAALLDKATPGPWDLGEFDEQGGYDCMTSGISCGPASIDGNTYGERYMEPLPPAAQMRMIADAALIVAAVNALPDLLAYVRELERERDQAISIRNVFADGLVRSVVDKTANLQGQPVDKTAELQARAAALAMRERCAQACEKLAYAEHQTGKVDHNEQAWTRVCAAAVRALEP